MAAASLVHSPSPPLAKLAFVDGDPTRMWEECTERLTSWQSDRHKPEFERAMADYSQQRAVNFVWRSNQLEGTLPSGISEQQAYRVLEEMYGSEPKEEANGGEQLGTRQLCQHMRAYLALCESSAATEEPLTERLIQGTHEVLMDSLDTEDGFPVEGGKYRHVSVCAGDYVFPLPHLVPSAMAKIVEEYNQKFAEKHDPFELASWLLYQVVTVHPFRDGNGRLCRLLACYSLMRDGLPFAVTVTSGHRKAQKHFVWALTRDRTSSRGGQSHMTTLMVSSVWQAWNNFFVNLQYDPAMLQCEV